MGSYWISVDPKPKESVLMRDRKGHTDMGGNHVNMEAVELCSHKPVNARSYQSWKKQSPRNFWRECGSANALDSDF